MWLQFYLLMLQNSSIMKQIQIIMLLSVLFLFNVGSVQLNNSVSLAKFISYETNLIQLATVYYSTRFSSM